MLKKILGQASKKQTFVSNSSSLVASRLVQSVTAFIVLAFIARTLGPDGLGQYTLAFSYYLVFMTLVSSGFKTLFTREISRNPSDTTTYLVSGTFLQLLFSILGYAAMCLVVAIMPYASKTTAICFILGLAIIPFSLSNVVEAIFQAQERMHLIAVCTIPIYIIRTLITMSVLWLGSGVTEVAAIFVISEGVIFFLEWMLIQKFVSPKWKINKAFIWKTSLSARTFLAIEGISVFRERVQVFILSLLASEGAIGLFGSVLQLMQPFSIVSSSVVLAIFPSMSKSSLLDPKKQRDLAEKTIEMLLFVSLPMFVGFLLLGKDLLLFLYKDPSFANAAVILSIVSFGMITRSFNQPLSYTLVANHRERVNLLEVINGTIIGCLVSILLVGKFQLGGAAVSTLFVRFFSLSIYLYGTYKFLFKLRLGRLFIRPLAVSAIMLIVFFISNAISLGFLSSLIVATVCYCLIMYITLVLFGKPSHETVS